MTANFLGKKKDTAVSSLKTSLCFILLSISLCFTNSLKEGVIYGLKICFTNIIPSLFPFFILADVWMSLIRIPPSSLLSKICRFLGINNELIDTFLIGNICGFPLGAKMATTKYSEGLMSKEELEAIIPLCTNPSLAFVVSGIGAGLLGNIKMGCILYFSTIISSVLIYLFSHTLLLVIPFLSPNRL